MNNVIVLGKVIAKSKIHFDYKDKLKSYFYLTVAEKNNIFDVVISEKYIKLFNIDMLYRNISINSVICIFENIIYMGNNYSVRCTEIFLH